MTSNVYSGIKAKDLTPDGEMALFDIIAGVLNTFVPYIIIMMLDYAMRIVKCD